MALRALSSHERTEAEMEGLLRERGFEEEVVAVLIGELSSSGAVDDARFAQRYAEDKREISHWGPERVRVSLERRGIPRELIEAAISADDYEEQISRGSRWLEGRDPDVETDAGRARALAALARQGYASEPSYEIIRRLERVKRDADPSG